MIQAPQPPIAVGLHAVLIAVTRETPRLLTLARDGLDGLPYGPLDAERDRTLEKALRARLRELTSLEVGYVEQLYTFGDRNRDPGERRGGPRNISISYLSLALEEPMAERGIRWRDVYECFPWEDWRAGRPEILDARIAPALDGWVAAASAGEATARRDRVDISFGFSGAPWDGERVLDRYELLYEAMLVDEAFRDHGEPIAGDVRALDLGVAMRSDHRRILATAIGRVRGKIRYRPVVFELVPDVFTLLELQRTVEALAGQGLHKQNFRRLVERGGLVEATGRTATGKTGRPAMLFRFRRDVLRERPAPGVGLPGLPSAKAPRS
ncbi:MAG: NAD regulator [Acidobacteriota bacterium]